MHATEMAATDTAAITGIDLTGYLVKDPARAIAFYRDVLGLTPTAVDEEGRGAEFSFADGSTFGVWKLEEDRLGGFVMFAVDDAHAATARLRERGLGLSDVLETPVCLMSYGSDPEGNAIIVHQRKKAT